MSAPTVTEKGYTIREGLSGPTDAQHPFIEGMVDGVGVVTAFESRGEERGWLLAVFPAFFEMVGVARPTAANVTDAADARRWVELLTALYAKAVSA
jgi:hypothetical protein